LTGFEESQKPAEAELGMLTEIRTSRIINASLCKLSVYLPFLEVSWWQARFYLKICFFDDIL
jgi:hypothetical protein